MTVTLYKYIQSELIKKGLNEIVDTNGNLVFFNEDHQFMPKIFSYDKDISDIVDKLFTGVSLDVPVNDSHFKKAFLYRFINRNINRQTIEAFKLELLSTFLMNKDYINRIYSELDKYLTQTKTGIQNNQQNNIETNSQTNTRNDNQTNQQTNTQTNDQTNDGTTTSDNRDAETTLPQNNVQIDVDSTVMTSANRNAISRNKQKNVQTTIGETVDNTTGENIGVSDSVTSGASESDTLGETSSEYKEYQLDTLFKTNGIQEQIYIIFDRKCFMQIW